MSEVRRRLVPAIVASLAAVLVLARLGAPLRAEEEGPPDPAEVTLGERLFLETRFAQWFAARSGGDVNARHVPGDPSLRRTSKAGGGSLPGPFAGASMNCRACHLVDEQHGVTGGGVRAYADFAARSPVPAREDGIRETLRNSPSLVDATFSFREEAPYLHFDAEFATAEDLVFGTLTGRNYGWMPTESGEAMAHVARVIREDDGTGELAEESGGRYRRLLLGTDPGIHRELRLPPAHRIDVLRATDAEVVRAAARLVAEYLRSLRFPRSATGATEGSSFDLFLEVNDLPRRLLENETPEAYTGRMRAAMEDLRRPRWPGRRGMLSFHGRRSRFGRKEWEGFRIFLARPGDGPEEARGVGNCASCHTLPGFTDRGFHLTGVSQMEYDRAHGTGAFLGIEVPGAGSRAEDPDAWFPVSPARPDATGPFASIPSPEAPGRADLGLWNVFLHPDIPGPQAAVRSFLEGRYGAIGDEGLLARTVGSFKTPSLRDLGQSAPYMHDGSRRTLRDSVRHYVEASDMARAGLLRGADDDLAGIRLDTRDERRLAAFLRSLDLDYD